jgi:hypothetical protein
LHKLEAGISREFVFVEDQKKQTKQKYRDVEGRGEKMAYMLYDGGGQGAQQDYFYQASGTVPKSKLNWEEFKKDLAKRVRVQKVVVAPTVPKNKEKEAEAEDEEETCLVCTDKLKDRCVLKSAPPSALPFPALFLLTRLRARAGLCRCENFPCEGKCCYTCMSCCLVVCRVTEQRACALVVMRMESSPFFIDRQDTRAAARTSRCASDAWGRPCGRAPTR